VNIVGFCHIDWNIIAADILSKY